MPTLGLIINTYEQPNYLQRVLAAVTRQVVRPEEVLLADDGSGTATREVIAAWAGAQTLRVEHAWQPHEAFRRARILNEAIARAQSEYLVFLDGDTVPHPEFVADHARLAQRGSFLQGHRALVERRAAAWFGLGDFLAERRRALWQGQLKGWKHAYRWPRPLVRQRTDLKGIRGCNLAVWRDDLVKVNGYNEAFVGWGREDSELAVRLMNAGSARRDVRGWAVCYHLWHPPADRAGLAANDGLLEQALVARTPRCAEGLNRHLPQPR